MHNGLHWLGKMPYKYQVLFLKRLSETAPAEIGKKEPPTISDYLSREFRSFETFLLNSFSWEKTPEGHHYWNEMSVTYI